MSTANTVYNPAQPVHVLMGKANITVSKNLQNIITYLHNKIGKDEWSGPLFYEILEGDVKDPNSLKIMAHHVHLQDIGTAAYTEYNQNAGDFMTVLEDYPDLMDGLMDGRIKIGHLHTHHSMDAFFSGTDTSELHDNSKNYNMYLSLIVNFAAKPVAKISIKGKRKIINSATEDKFQFTGQLGSEDVIQFNTAEQNKEYDCIVEVNCDVEFEVDEQVVAQYNLIKEKKKTPVYNHNNYNSYNGYGWKNGVWVGYGEGGNENFQRPHESNKSNQSTQNPKTPKEGKDEWGIPTDTLTSTMFAKLILGDFNDTRTAYMALVERNRIRQSYGDPEKLADTARVYNEFKQYVAYCLENDAIGNDRKIKPTNIVLREVARSMKFWCKTYRSIPYSANLEQIFENLIQKYDKLVKDGFKSSGKELELGFSDHGQSVD